MVVISRAHRQGGTLRTPTESLNLFASMADEPTIGQSAYQWSISHVQTLSHSTRQPNANSAEPRRLSLIRSTRDRGAGGEQSAMDHTSDNLRKQQHARGGRFGRPSSLAASFRTRPNRQVSVSPPEITGIKRHLSYGTQSRQGGFVSAAASPAATLTRSVL